MGAPSWLVGPRSSTVVVVVAPSFMSSQMEEADALSFKSLSQSPCDYHQLTSHPRRSEHEHSTSYIVVQGVRDLRGGGAVVGRLLCCVLFLAILSYQESIVYF